MGLHTLFCLGRTYPGHAREMGAAPPPEPLVFLKPLSSLRRGARVEVRRPARSSDLHHEVELVMLTGRGPADQITPLAYGVGLDMTLRDVQQQAKAAGHPWTGAKAFPGAALVSPLLPVEALGTPVESLRVELWREGTLRQEGSVSGMIWTPAQLLALLDDRFGLLGGELIFLGTPEGVGPVEPGTALEARLVDGRGRIRTKMEVLID